MIRSVQNNCEFPKSQSCKVLLGVRDEFGEVQDGELQWKNSEQRKHSELLPQSSFYLAARPLGFSYMLFQVTSELYLHASADMTGL